MYIMLNYSQIQISKEKRKQSKTSFARSVFNYFLIDREEKQVDHFRKEVYNCREFQRRNCVNR